MIKRISLLVVLALTLLVAPSMVYGHAYLEHSIPIQESELTGSPPELRLQFTEPIDTRVSQVTLENEEGETIAGTNVYGADPITLVVEVPELDDGIYYVNWQVLALDTHVTDGSFRFAIGVELPALRPDETVSIDEALQEQADEPSSNPVYEWMNTSLRIVELLLVTGIIGWVIFQRLLWRKDGDIYLQRSNNSGLNRERRLYLIGFIVLFITGLIHIMARSVLLMQTSWTDPLLWETFMTIYFTSLLGIVSWLRPLLFLLLYVITWVRNMSLFPVKLVLFVMVLFTFPYTGHAYHANTVLVHGLHMAAVVVWFAGLIGFVLYSFTIRRETEALRYLHNRLKVFSTLALMMVIFVVVSGLILGVVYLESWENVITSDYGTVMLWKVGIFSLALIVAAFHRFVWLPNLERMEQQGAKWRELGYMIWGLRVELLLAMVVLIAAGMLSNTPPPVDIHGGDYDHNH